MYWRGWGDPDRAVTLPYSVVELLRRGLGVQPAGEPAELHEIELPASGLPAAAATALVHTVGSDHVHTDPESRVRHMRGKSTTDLLRIRAGDGSDAPDAVVHPASHDEVIRVLEACSQHDLAVVPFGGGTSVVGGLAPHRSMRRAIVALDLARLDRMLAIDEESRLATLEPGLRAPAAEAALRSRGFTLGHFPQSYEWASIGGFAATRASGQASAGYGRFDDLVVRLRVATPVGTLAVGRAPKASAGPDLRQLILGSEGTFGVITAVTVQVRPAPESSSYEGWRFGDFRSGMAAMRRLAQDGPLPSVLRLSDEAETAVGLADPGSIGGRDGTAGCLLIAGYEGTAADVAHRREQAAAVLVSSGGEPLGPDPGERWVRGRFDGPYLRDALLDAGAIAETLETATFWSGLADLYDAVRAVLTEALSAQGTPPLVLCHVSHVYPSGGSLYFTVVSAQGTNPVAHWSHAKEAAMDAIMAAGGTISHHHGVGVDHRPWYPGEIGPLGVDVLRAVKATLDPAGVLNPGVLLPDPPRSA